MGKHNSGSLHTLQQRLRERRERKTEQNREQREERESVGGQREKAKERGEQAFSRQLFQAIGAL